LTIAAYLNRRIEDIRQWPTQNVKREA